MSKIKIEDIRQAVEEQGWKLLSESYTNLDTPLSFECPEGHSVFAPWKKFREGCVCPNCIPKPKETFLNSKIEPKSKNTIRTLALDQATRVTGWSIYDNDKLVKFGVFETNLNDEIARCNQIKMWLISMIQNWRPDHIGLEDIQFQEESAGRKMGVTVFQTLAHLQGILMETCYEYKIPFMLCHTNVWRHHCGVKGKARADKKRSMQLLAKQWYGINASEDEADAIGIGKYVSSQVGIKIETQNWE